MTGAPPSPARLGRRLLGSLAALAAVQAAWIAAGAALLRGVAATDALLRAAAFGLLVFAVLAAAVAETVRRTAPLYRAIVRRDRDGFVPPSQAALRDAMSAPSWLAFAVGAPPLVLAAADLLSGGHTLAPSGGRGVELAAFVASAGLFALGPAAVLVRHAMRPWIGAFRPEDQTIEHRRPRAPAASLEISLPVVAATLACAALVAGNVSGGVPALAAWVLAAVLGAAAMAIGAYVQSAISDDAKLLVARSRDAAAPTAAAPPAEARLGGDGYRTREMADLATEVEAMAARYAGTARGEDAARESVEELQRSKMLFMASMSHDLRSPLNSILGFSELLSRTGQGALSEAQRENVRMIAKSGEELLHLLEDVLDSARYEAGRLQLRRDWTPSVEILTEAVRRGRELVADRDVELVAELQPGLPPVFVDRDRIVQAVVGLFRHAARAMTGGTLRMYARVDTTESGGRLRVDVVDPIGSIREEDRERIFEAFREITSTTGRRIGGLGLTLSLARALVRAHGGDVWIESRAGEATTFTVGIPLSAE